MLCARLHFGGHAEHASMFQAVRLFEVIKGFVEHEVRFAINTRQTLLQARIQRVQAFFEGFGIALIMLGIGRVGGAEVGRHPCGDHARIDGRQPQVRIHAAWTVIVVMFVGFVGMRMAIFAENSQFHARQVLHGHRCRCTAFKHTRQKRFHVWPNPVQQVDRLHAPYVGWAQSKVMRRRAWRQQYLWNSHPVLHGSRDQLQRLDARQHLDLGLSGTRNEQTGDKYDKNGKKSGHDDHSMA